jgi:hypothetical protein
MPFDLFDERFEAPTTGVRGHSCIGVRDADLLVLAALASFFSASISRIGRFAAAHHKGDAFRVRSHPVAIPEEPFFHTFLNGE